MPLTLQIASDIHLEKRLLPFEKILKPSADVLALVGDIGSPFVPSLEQFLGWCSARFVHVFYVPGNHEYYNEGGFDTQHVNGLLRAMCERYPNVHFMYNTTVVVDGFAFIGSILWSHVPQEHKAEIERLMNDYRYIYKRPGVLVTVDDTNAEYQKNVAWLSDEVGRARVASQTPVVLTHHTPSFVRTSAPQYDGGVSKYAFSSKIACAPGTVRLWCCGHTHYNFHHDEEGYELISNQFGYNTRGIAGYNSAKCIRLAAIC